MFSIEISSYMSKYFLFMEITNNLCLSFPDLFRFQVAIFNVIDNKTDCSGSIINPSDANIIKLCYPWGAPKKYVRTFITYIFQLWYLAVKVEGCFFCMINLLWLLKINKY